MGAADDEEDDPLLTGIHESQLHSFVRHWKQSAPPASTKAPTVSFGEPPADDADDGDRDGDDEPGATRVYDDQVLLRAMTREELEALRREMLRPSIAPPDADDDDDDGGRTSFGVAGAIRVQQIRDRLDALDYAGALTAAERFHQAEPDNELAERWVALCRKALGRAYRARLGSGDDAPRLVVGFEEITKLDLDSVAAFVVSRIDGTTTLDELVDVAALPQLDVLRLVFELVQRGVVTIEPARSSHRP